MNDRINSNQRQFLGLLTGPDTASMRLVELHEASKSCPQEDRHYYEREIALRHAMQAQRERRELTRDHCSWQPIPFA